MKKFKNAFIVTGTIGSGKSSFCEMLKKRGYTVLDADRLGHIVLDENTELIANEFGEDVVSNGIVDRKKLGEKVFNDDALLNKLGEITHPKILDKITQKCIELEAKNRPYFIEISLYFEKFSECGFENVVVVYAPQSELFERIKARNNWDDEHINARISSQIDMEKKRKMATFVIDNSTDHAGLEAKVDEFLASLEQKCGS